jgi:DNA excision repair protein ERCC-4
VYLEGGVLFITARILVVDLLMERAPAHLITGILLYRAHRVIDSCQESFILRLFREKNKKGFIKAFSGSPVSFSSGYCKVERVMRNLFVRHLHLWPRFQSTVTSVLAANQPEVIEIHLELTPQMQEVQTAVLDLLGFTLKEVKRLNPSLDTAELTVENCVSKSFHKMLQRELHPIWHQLSSKTRQLVSDLKTLRAVLTYLTQYDAITFFNFVSTLKTAESAMKSGGWVLLDSAETLFLTAQARVFPDKGKAAKDAKRTKKEQEGFEENPKWEEIGKVVEEIKQEIKAAGREAAEPRERALIVTRDERTAGQVRAYLAVGGQKLLGRMFNKCLGEKFGYLPGNFEETVAETGPPAGRGKGPGGTKSTPVGPEVAEPEGEVGPLAVTLHALDSCETFDTTVLLEELQPRYIILYDSDMAFVRQIEVYQAQRPGLHTRVYFMLYRGSVEEQAYLTTIRREKKAFESLIAEKASMVIPEDRELGLEREAGKASDHAVGGLGWGRRAGGAEAPAAAPRVIVDMREFRSALPSLLHKRGIDIEPVTLEVGDYIVTPEICLERKSLSDLIGSLQNGRLYSQATAMTRFYAKPMLLIEFEAEQSFSLQGKLYMSRDVQTSDLMARLQLLTIHFPKLRILWSPSPHATAELVEELKKGRDQPEASKAATLGVDIIDEYNVDKFNPQIKDLLSKLPGVNSKNIFGLLNRAGSLSELASCPQVRRCLSPAPPLPLGHPGGAAGRPGRRAGPLLRPPLSHRPAPARGRASQEESKLQEVQNEEVTHG